MVHSKTSNSCLIKCDWFLCYVLSQIFTVFHAMTELNTYTYLEENVIEKGTAFLGNPSHGE